MSEKDNVRIQTNQYKILIKGEKKDSKSIYLDIDGVVGDWLKRCCETLGLDPEDDETRKRLKNEDRTYSIAGVSEVEMWKKIDADGTEWWSGMDVLPWGKRLYDALNNLGDVIFLTSPADSSPCWSGKVEWVQKHFGKDCEIMIGKNKWRCSTPNSYLVDDSKHKVLDFRKGAGNAYIWPNQYKLMDGDQDVNGVIEKLVKIIKG